MIGQANETSYPAAIRAELRTQWLGRALHYRATVGSTNDILSELAGRDAPAGTLIVADYQEQGKGRLGRRWLAPAGTSLLISLLFRPNWPPEKTAWLTMIAGLAAVESVEEIAGLSAGLKWPNDLMLHSDGEWRKVGGLLLEGQFVDGRLTTAILGIGINVNIESEQLPATGYPATSLLIDSGRMVAREKLLGHLLTSLEPAYEAAARGKSPKAEWERHLVTLGQQIQLSQSDSDQTLTGVAESVDEWGRLIVRDDTGRRHACSAGDVTLQVDNSGD